MLRDTFCNDAFSPLDSYWDAIPAVNRQAANFGFDHKDFVISGNQSYKDLIEATLATAPEAADESQCFVAPELDCEVDIDDPSCRLQAFIERAETPIVLEERVLQEDSQA